MLETNIVRGCHFFKDKINSLSKASKLRDGKFFVWAKPLFIKSLIASYIDSNVYMVDPVITEDRIKECRIFDIILISIMEYTKITVFTKYFSKC